MLNFRFRIMDENTKKTIPYEKVLEITNAINAAVFAGKIVTLDLLCSTVQVGGAIPGFCLCTDVYCILNELESPDTVKVVNASGFIIRAYYPWEETVEIIYDPKLDYGLSADSPFCVSRRYEKPFERCIPSSACASSLPSSSLLCRRF